METLRMQQIRLTIQQQLFALTCMLLVVGVKHISSGQTVTGAHKRFEYKLSFKGPYMVQSDGMIPFWEHFGHAIASDESVRLTPSLKSKKGSIWSKELNSHENWEVELVFRVNGRGRIGADGLAFWYTETRAEEGPVFGSRDNWKGLGLFFDSFDNDNLRNNPWIMAMVNNGEKSYEHETDGGNQHLGGCQRDFRNKPFPVRAKIEYYKKALTVHIHNGLTNNRNDFELCLRAEGVELPSNGYFGVSAATGDLADDHDVLSFLTHSLTPQAETSTGQQVPDEERKKFEEEYQQYHDKLQKAKESYKKDHPAKPGEMDDEEDKMYDSIDVRELRMIFDGQNAMHQVLRTLLVKLDEIVGRQERELSMLTLINQQGGAGRGEMGHPGSQGQQQLPPVNTIQRHEVDSVLASHRDLASNVRDIRTLLNDVQSKVNGIGSSSSGQHGTGKDSTQSLQAVQSQLSNLERDVKMLVTRPQTGGSNCPPTEPVNCVTTFYLVSFLVLQLVCIIGYMFYRSSKEAAAKKFY